MDSEVPGSTPHKDSDQPKTGINNAYIREYKALKESLGLESPVISYPACGSDISLSQVFDTSETYYIDTDGEEIEAIRAAGLPSDLNHLIVASAYEYTPPKPIDLVVLRNPSTDSHDIVGLTRGLRTGGYVIESHWGSTYGARELLGDPGFALTGAFKKNEDNGEDVTFETNTVEITKKLNEDTEFISKYAGVGYVFQKVKPQIS